MTMQLGNPVIELNDVGYYYTKRSGYFSRKRFWALNKVNFTLSSSESLGIIGKNGAGKSTLLRLLAGIIKPDEGTLVNHGVSASLLSLQAGFVPYLTGRENTLLSGIMLGMKKKFIQERIEEIRAFSELEDFFDQPISSYSSGMRARLGFSIAFQLDPDVLLIDEVLGVGDESFKSKSSKKIREKIASDKTVVVVSHTLSYLQELCNRAVWIEKGRTMAEGTTSDVMEEYKSYLKHQIPGSTLLK